MVLATVRSFRLAEAGALLFGHVEEDVDDDSGGEKAGGGKEDELGAGEDGAVEGCAGSIRVENGLSSGAET